MPYDTTAPNLSQMLRQSPIDPSAEPQYAPEQADAYRLAEARARSAYDDRRGAMDGMQQRELYAQQQQRYDKLYGRQNPAATTNAPLDDEEARQQALIAEARARSRFQAGRARMAGQNRMANQGGYAGAAGPTDQMDWRQRNQELATKQNREYQRMWEDMQQQKQQDAATRGI